MKTNRRIGGARTWSGSVFLACGLAAAVAQAGWDPGTGIKAGRLRISPFADVSVGYDSNVRLAEGEILPLNMDGSYQVQSSEKKGDYFSQLTAGFGISRQLESEWDLRFRAWYDTRLFGEETDSNYDSVTAEASARYWPVSDKYMVSAGGKYRESQDVGRVPSSASLTMPGEMPLPYLEERSDRLKRVSVDGFANVNVHPGDRSDFGFGAIGSSVNYDDKQLFDYWNWRVTGSAGYRFTEKTAFFGTVEYQTVGGDSLSKDIPVYAFRVGLRTRPREKIDYSLSVGAKTYEHFNDPEGLTKDDRVDFDFNGILNWRYSEKLNFFGKAWTDVSAAIQVEENTRRTYAGQLGANYAFMKRLSAAGAVSYRVDAYDFPIDYGEDRVQDQTELWQVMGRLTLTPRANAFWKMYLEGSYETGDNDLDDYDQWQVWLGASVWY